MQQLRFSKYSNQLNMFRAKISSILRSTRLCLHLDEVELMFHLIQVTGWQHRLCIILQAVNTV